MAEASSYIYIMAPIFGALVVAIGAIVVTISPAQIRHARSWFLASAIPFFLVPITFGATAENRTVGLIGATLGAFFLALVYYAANVFLSERIRDADQKTQDSSTQGATNGS